MELTSGLGMLRWMDTWFHAFLGLLSFVRG
jgi:hypothetical protein